MWNAKHLTEFPGGTMYHDSMIKTTLKQKAEYMLHTQALFNHILRAAWAVCW